MRTPFTRRRLRIWLVLALAMIGLGTGARAQAPSGAATLEAQVKAAFLYNFVSFTEWPAAAFPSASSPLRICVFNSEPLAVQLELVVRGEVAAGHALVVDRITEDDEAARCQLLFVPREQAAHAGALLHTLGKAPVLTVGESDGFLHEGGVINFVIDQGHVRFDVNRKIASERALMLSSKLLKVARSVM